MGIPTTMNETTKVILTLQGAQGLSSVGTGRLRRRCDRELSRLFLDRRIELGRRGRVEERRGHRVEQRHEARRIIGFVRYVGP